MKLTIKKGTTSKLLRIFVTDSSKTDGSGLTGLVHNTASLTAYYIREGAASATAITLVTATVGTFTSSGFKEVDAANMPGIYELHPPNACLASGADSVLIFLKGAANMAPLPIEIQLDDNTTKDVYDRIGAPAGASVAADLVTIDNVVDVLEARLTAARAGYLDNMSAGAVALASTALTNATWTDAKAGFIDVAISGRAPANEYDTQMGYIPSNLGDVPTDSELDASHGSGAWTTADVSALATAIALSTHDTKLDAVKAKTDTIDWGDITSLIDEIGGKWEITGNQMIFYKADNMTEIFRFNLFDSGGNPAMTNVYKRERVP